MKRVAVKIAGLLLVFGLLAAAISPRVHAQAAQSAASEDALRQVAGILAYIAGDYGGAVGPDRAILNQDELTEQVSLAKDADALAAQAGIAEGAGVRTTLAELRAVLDQVAAPQQVTAVCRRAHDQLVNDHHVALAPTSLPDRQRAASLYRSSGCNTCHGDDGSANTEAAAKLDPRPANFLDPERVAAVSPHRAFYAISYGVAGTGMTSYRTLNETDRWSLAFYVMSLRHDATLAKKGAATFAAASVEQSKSARALAMLTDDDLREALARNAHTKNEHATQSVLAYLRYAAPFEREAGGSLDGLQRGLQAGLTSYSKGDQAGARRLFVAAYLDELEPQEPVIRARSAELVGEMERTMLALREAAAVAGQQDVVAGHVATMERLIARAQAEKTTPTAALISALTISLREGLEIALLIGALLGLVRKRGHAELVRFVHAGWLLAIPAGLLTWWLAGSVLGGLERELAEGIAAIAAALMLLGVTHWLLGQLTAKRFMGFLGGQFSSTLAGSASATPGGDGMRRAKLGVLGLSFVAAYREAFELVLFFQALLLDAGDAQAHVWLGVALSVVLLAGAAFALKLIGQRLQPRPFMLASSGLLAVLAVVLIGKGTRALQEAGVIGISTLGQFSVPTLGFHATTQGLLAQGSILALLIGSALWAWREDQRPPPPVVPTAAE